MWGTDDKFAIAKHLGYPLAMSSLEMIEQAQSRVANLGDGAIAICQQYLQELDKIRSELDEARPYATRAYQSSATGSTQYRNVDRLQPMRTEGRRYVNLLAEAMQLMVMGDTFAGGVAGGARSARG